MGSGGLKLDSDEQGINLVYDAGLKKIGQQLSSVESLDVKMGVLIGFLGALVAGLLAALLVSEESKISDLFSGVVTRSALAATIVLLVFDLYFAFQSFRVRKLYTGVQFQDLVDWADEQVRETKVAFLPTLIEAVDLNESQLKVKQRNAARAVRLVFVTLLVLLMLLVAVGIRLLKAPGGLHG